MRRGTAGTLCAVAALGMLAAHAPSASAVPSRTQPPLAGAALSAAAGAIDGVTLAADDAALNRIIEAVQRRYNARVVKVTEVSVDGRRAYELRLLSEQRVWTIRVDAESGQELPRSE